MESGSDTGIGSGAEPGAAVPAASAGAVPRPSGVLPVALSSLLTRGGPGARLSGSDVAVAGMTMSSSLVRPGDLFAAAPGRHSHGAGFAAAAVLAGALAVLTDEAGSAMLDAGVPRIVVRDVREQAGPVAAMVYGDPSGELDLLAVTGTSGKTTTSFLLRAGLQAAGRVSAIMGTVATMIGAEVIKTGFTTPEAPELQALLAVMRERGATTVAMEVSSHALRLGRVGGIEFAVGAFTNLSEDHLDFHTDMDDYFAAKALLFDGRSRVEVVVVDDDWGARLVRPATVTVSTTGTEAAWRADRIREDEHGRLAFRVRGPEGDFDAGCALPGRYNVANTLLALAVLHENGVAAREVAPAVALATVPGRMERVDAGQDYLAVVDYSHKPAAVRGALAALRPLTRGRLIVVLGCGGDRDRHKRPMMGRIAAQDADLLIVTDDNPRSERPADIRRAMLDGAAGVPASQRAEVREIGDRREAIEAAVREARTGDTVLVAGKGHEPGQEIDGVVHPFDDRDVLRDMLRGAHA